MTASPDAPRLAFDDLADAVRALRESGHRLSTPRRLVLEALFAADGPVSATYLVQRLSLEESSVYRNLEVLEHQGLVRHIHLGHGPGLYALAGDNDVEYLYCERCAKVTPVAPEELEPLREHIRERFGHLARFSHFAIVGLCDDCPAEPDARSRRAEDRPAADAGDQLHSHGDHIHAHPPEPSGHQH